MIIWRPSPTGYTRPTDLLTALIANRLHNDPGLEY